MQCAVCYGLPIAFRTRSECNGPYIGCPLLSHAVFPYSMGSRLHSAHVPNAICRKLWAAHCFPYMFPQCNAVCGLPITFRICSHKSLPYTVGCSLLSVHVPTVSCRILWVAHCFPDMFPLCISVYCGLPTAFRSFSHCVLPYTVGCPLLSVHVPTVYCRILWATHCFPFMFPQCYAVYCGLPTAFRSCSHCVFPYTVGCPLLSVHVPTVYFRILWAAHYSPFMFLKCIAVFCGLPTAFRT